MCETTSAAMCVCVCVCVCACMRACVRERQGARRIENELTRNTQTTLTHSLSHTYCTLLTPLPIRTLARVERVGVRSPPRRRIRNPFAESRSPAYKRPHVDANRRRCSQRRGRRRDWRRNRVCKVLLRVKSGGRAQEARARLRAHHGSRGAQRLTEPVAHARTRRHLGRGRGRDRQPRE